MNQQNRVETLCQEINEKLKTLFREQKPDNLYQPMLYPLDSGGKRIRPLLVILSCEAVGGTKDICMNAAIAVELLHTFTLVHDDIMDHDRLRRGKPTVHIKWDEPTAILAGDGLVTMAYQSLLETEHTDYKEVLQTFTKGLLILCEGQALDKAFEDEDDVSLDLYHEMIQKKTAKLIEVSCEIGAILGNGTIEERNALIQFANKLGQAFQIQDDMLDLLTEQEILGKPMGSDLIERKKTFLTIHFLNHASPPSKKQFFEVWGKSSLLREDILQIRSLFKESNTLESAQKTVYQLISKSLSSLNQLTDNPSTQLLRNLAMQIRNRLS